MKKLNIIYYSPTGTSKSIVEKISEGIELRLDSEYNLSKQHTKNKINIEKDSLTIFGFPVYGGRLPENIIDELKKIKGNDSFAVIVVIYGNRAYEDALLELKDIVSENGFNVIGAGAFIGEHSFSTQEKPIAENRPDESDFTKCNDFAKMINEKLLNQEKKELDIDIPGDYPYKERKSNPLLIHPETNYEKCINCKVCVKVCSTNAISDFIETNRELCTWCHACVKSCPTGARTFDHEAINSIRERLFSACSKRKEPEFFV
ncbi:MAG: EFR1 family ferrodoxin [Fusobacteriaceae bacterium]|nr:EFR1 family ferrodoxin [Fusobacteriaceae bacterium]MBN2838202.1 EFR1 family ferrodoxin [Fusobacteriaceae bacterium]